MTRRISIWLGPAILLLVGLGAGSWAAQAAYPTGEAKPQSVSPKTQDAQVDPALVGINAPLRGRWWETIPGVNSAAKMTHSLRAGWSDNPDSERGFMVYMKAQADTSNNITDWNAKGEYVLRQLETVANATQPDLMGAIGAQEAADNVSRATQFTIINAVFVRGNMAAAETLAQRPDVAFLEAEHRYTLHRGNVTAQGTSTELAQAGQSSPDAIEPGVNYVKAPQAWAMGYRGDGIVVGSIDTGGDYLHAALNRQYRGNLGGGNYNHNYNWFDARADAPRQNVPYDDDGHGSHTIGTVMGDDGDPGTNQIGVAPHAKWISVKIFPDGGSSGNEEITTAEDFMLAPWDLNKQNRRPDLRPNIVSNSWGDSECFNTDSFLILQVWISAGIMPSFSNGNSGPAAGTVGSPGAYPFLMGVGAISATTGNIAGFSSRGPSCYGGVLKPDVVAPGVGVRSSFPPSGSCPAPCYGAISGTSMAQPHNAGVMALILDANSSLNYTEVTGILTRTTNFLPSWGTRPNNNYGWGVIQADGAVNMALHAPRVGGAVRGSGTPLIGAEVTARRTSDGDTYRAQTLSTGSYSMTVLAGTYVMTATAFGYTPQTLSNQVFMTDTNVTVNFDLTALARYPVTARLYQNGACTPITGTLSFDPPGSLQLEGSTIETTLPAGTYTVYGNAGAVYQPITETLVVADGPITKDITFGPAHDNGNTYTAEVAPYNYISGTTQITFDDPEDGAASVALPFPFTFYGSSYSSLYVSTNGFATFINDINFARMWVNTEMPNPGPTSDSPAYRYPNNAIYAYWDDLTLAPRAYGNAYYGVSGASPNRIFTIEWRGVGGTNAPISFEIQIEETTNRITLVYGNVDSPYGNGYSSTQGIENLAGTDGIMMGFNDPGMVRSNTAIRIKPEAPPTVVPCVGATATPTMQPSSTTVPVATNTSVAVTNTPAAVTNTPAAVTNTPGVATATQPAATSTMPAVTATPIACSLQFQDVPQGNTFYANVRCLACRGILGGYTCGGTGEPCGTSNNPYFRPNTNITRGQIAKIVSESAGFSDAAGSQIYEDVPTTGTFYQWINRLSRRGHVTGYPCGGTGEPCGTGNRPYFRPFANATRGQLSKIVSSAAGFNDEPIGQLFQDVPEQSTFYVFIQRLAQRGIMGGYTCGGAGEPCGTTNKPYFRPNNDVTRGQASKIVANTFFANCGVAARR